MHPRFIFPPGLEHPLGLLARELALGGCLRPTAQGLTSETRGPSRGLPAIRNAAQTRKKTKEHDERRRFSCGKLKVYPSIEKDDGGLRASHHMNALEPQRFSQKRSVFAI